MNVINNNNTYSNSSFAHPYDFNWHTNFVRINQFIILFGMSIDVQTFSLHHKRAINE